MQVGIERGEREDCERACGVIYTKWKNGVTNMGKLNIEFENSMGEGRAS